MLEFSYIVGVREFNPGGTLKLVMTPIALFSRESTDRQTDGQTDATKCIISLASRSITMAVKATIFPSHPHMHP